MTATDEENLEQWRSWARPFLGLNERDELVGNFYALGLDDLLRQIIAERIDPESRPMLLQDVHRALQDLRVDDDPEPSADASELLKMWRGWARGWVSWPGRPVPEDPVFSDDVMQKIIAVRVEAGDTARSNL